MLNNVKGDILLSKSEAIAHGVAPNDDFKQGLALALRERYPSMVKDFRHWCHAHHPKPGQVWIWSGVGEDGHAVRVINLLTQEPAPAHGSHPGKASEANVNHALHALKKLIAAEELKSVALPRLGTGVGGLDWEKVQPLITDVLNDAGCDVNVYGVYEPGVAAEEG